MKEQLAKMTIIELVRTAHSYSTSIKQTGVYSELVREMASRLEALNLAHIGAMAALETTAKRIAELKARTLTVKLKQYDEFWIEHIAPGCPDGYAKGFIDGRNYGEKQIKTACADAGLKLQIERE